MSSKTITDLEEKLKENAWKMYEMTKRPWQFWKPRHKNDVKYVFDLSKVEFFADEELKEYQEKEENKDQEQSKEPEQTKDQKESPGQEENKDQEQSREPKQTEDQKECLEQTKMQKESSELEQQKKKDESKKQEKKKDTPPKPAVETGRNICIFKSVFKNKSGGEQTQILKAERQTTVECTASLNTGFTTSTAVNLTLKSPIDIIEASVGYSEGFSVTNNKQTSEQKTLTWSIEGNLTVPPKSSMTAEVQIVEKQYRYKFSTRVGVKGMAIVKLFDHHEKQLSTFTQRMTSLFHGDSYKKINDIVFIDATGECAFKFGTEQETLVSVVETKDIGVQANSVENTEIIEDGKKVSKT